MKRMANSTNDEKKLYLAGPEAAVFISIETGSGRGIYGF